MLSRLGIDAPPAVQYVIAFVVIFGLLALLALGLRRLSGSRLSMTSQERGRARQPRLGVVDVYDLDRQRQLILLRRDNVEHLLLIGGPNDLVVETNIARVPVRAAAPAENGFERVEQASDTPARPVVEPPRPGPDAAVSARLGSLAGPGNDVSDAEEELAPIGATSSQPARARMEPVLKPDAVAPVPVRPSGASPAAPVRPTGAPRADVPAPVPPAARPASAPDPSLLSDMAKQLEQALRRPAAPAQPRPAAAPGVPQADPAPAQPAPVPPRRPDAVRPVAPTRPVTTPTLSEAPAQPEDGPPSGPSAEIPARQPPSAPVAAPTAPVVAAAVPPTSPQPGPATPVLQANAAPSPAPAPPPATPPAAAPPPPASPPPTTPVAPARAGPSDPFSVEEIEAEFARLLGRPLDKTDNR